MANILIAVLATALGYTTSAVVAEVRNHDSAVTPIVVAEMPAQFRPIIAAEAPAFVSTAAPALNVRAEPSPQMAAARAFVVARTVGVER